MTPTYFIWALMPVVGALIGWLTNRLAIWMLFHPRAERRWLGLRWQGLIPRRHAQIAEETGEIVAREILTRHVIVEQVNRLDLTGYIDTYSQRLVWDRLGPRLRGFPLLGKLVNDRLLAQLHVLVNDEMRRESQSLLRQLGDEVEQQLDIKRLIADKMRAFELTQMERLIWQLAGREFRQIEFLGGVLGFLVGLGQVGLLVLAAQLWGAG